MNRPRTKDRHLPRGVYLRHGAYYHVRHGKWENLGRDLRGALARYAANMEEPGGGMADLIDQAFPVITRSASKNTIAAYKQAVRRLKKALVEFSPDQVRPKHVAGLKLQLSKTPTIANLCLTVLRLVFAFAVENQLVDANPAVGIKPYPGRKRDRLLLIGELQAIRSKSAPQLQVIIDLSMRTGQRISDVLKIRRADLMPEGIRFQQQKTKAKGIVPWTPELEAIVARAKALSGTVSYLTLLHDRGKPPRYATVRRQWQAAVRAAGVQDARLHDLRAFAATWAKKQGKNPTALLMHASVSQTDRYLRDKDAPVTEGPSFDHLMDKRS